MYAATSLIWDSAGPSMKSKSSCDDGTKYSRYRCITDCRNSIAIRQDYAPRAFPLTSRHWFWTGTDIFDCLVDHVAVSHVNGDLCRLVVVLHPRVRQIGLQLAAQVIFPFARDNVIFEAVAATSSAKLRERIPAFVGTVLELDITGTKVRTSTFDT